MNNVFYTTIEGDAFDIIALDFYNDEYKSTHIINANPDHANTVVFSAGIRLKIPELTQEKSSTLPPWQR